MFVNRTVGVVVGLALVIAACGSDTNTNTSSDESPVAETTQSVVETTQSMAETTQPMAETTQPVAETTDGSESDAAAAIESVPSAILSLSPTATEMLFAIDAGDLVLAVDDLSNFPDEAASKMRGLSAFEPNVEAIAGIEPDLVVTDGTNPDFLAQLDSLGIAHYEAMAATDFDDVYDQIEQLGALTGHIGEAAELVSEMQTEVEAVKAELPELAAPLTYYHELDPTLYSVSSDTFIGSVYTELGLVNIVDSSDEDLGAYPQLSAEFIVDADPDLIFLACTKYCGETVETLATRPGWENLTAVTNAGVIEMDDDIASRWGPRMVEYLALAGAAVARVVETQAAG